VGVGARHRDAAGLDRLAQGFEGGALELRNYVAVSPDTGFIRQVGIFVGVQAQ
jgi:hypothetical protein